MIGYAAGNSTTGSNNVVVGRNAFNITGGTTNNNNVVIGDNAGLNGAPATSNVYIGTNANTTSQTGAQTGCMCIGANSILSGATLGETMTNRIAIGVGARATVNNGLFFPGTVGGTALAGISATALHYDATSGQVGPFTSSQQFKENIEPLEVDSSVVYDFTPRSFNYKNAPDKRVFGYIAEELNEVLPSVVPKMNDQPYSVNYDVLVVLAIEEIKKLRERIESLEAQSTPSKKYGLKLKK